MCKRRPTHHTFILATCLTVATGLSAAETGSRQRPGYLDLVKDYAEAMIKEGRDTYGAEHSPLFASALDRKTMKIGSFGDIPGVRNSDRSLGGANPQTDARLYAVLYDLTELTGEKKYAQAADKALAFFFTHCQSAQTGLLAWGEHLYWDFNKEASNEVDGKHEVCGEWPLWDRCYTLAPDACWNFAVGLWDHQVADKKTGDFSRHATWSSHGPGRGADFPRYAGQMIACWADAYGRPCNAGREGRPSLASAVSVMVSRMESNMTKAPTGYLIAGTDATHRQIAWPGSNLELARCLWKSAPQMEGDLALRMKRLALLQDAHVLGLPHTLSKGGGFVACVDSSNGMPRARSMNKPYTETWSTGYGHGIHADMANQCVDRLRQIEGEHPDLAAKYRELVVAAADLYVTAQPDSKELLMPGSIASVIQLMLSGHALTGAKNYAERADFFGQLGVSLFLSDGLPLPKATSRHGHYEAITGGPDFMHALLCLHRSQLHSSKTTTRNQAAPWVNGTSTSTGVVYQGGSPPVGRTWVMNSQGAPGSRL